MQWFTSDLHFAHPHVAKLRGFEDYREHDRQIIRNLNEMVAPDDDLYVLGDISSGSKDGLEKALACLHRLNVGRTHRVLILGNHDSTRLEAGKIRKFTTEFSQVALRGTTTIHGYGNVLLSHYPYANHLDDGPHDGLSTNATSPVPTPRHTTRPQRPSTRAHARDHTRRVQRPTADQRGPRRMGTAPGIRRANTQTTATQRIHPLTTKHRYKHPWLHLSR